MNICTRVPTMHIVLGKFRKRRRNHIKRGFRLRWRRRMKVVRHMEFTGDICKSVLSRTDCALWTYVFIIRRVLKKSQWTAAWEFERNVKYPLNVSRLEHEGVTCDGILNHTENTQAVYVFQLALRIWILTLFGEFFVAKWSLVWEILHPGKFLSSLRAKSTVHVKSRGVKYPKKILTVVAFLSCNVKKSVVGERAMVEL